MRTVGILTGVIILAGSLAGQTTSYPKKYEIEVNLGKYPQSTPQKAMESVARVLTEGHWNYLMAHLANPEYVDTKVNAYKKLYDGPEKAVELVAFDQLVKEVRDHFAKDPSLAQELIRSAKEGKWELEEAKGKANVRLPEVASRRAYFVQVKGRWYLQNPR